MNTDPLLQVEHLRKTYKSGNVRLEVLSDVNFTVLAGEVIALMGPSGVGKTTLLNLIGALDLPDSGAVILDGKRLSDLSRRKLAQVRNRRLGFVFQFHHLLPEFTAVENVLIPGMISGQISEQEHSRASSLLETFGLDARASHYPHELSGGERQRVALARALMNSPALVLADEPTGNLDRKSGARLIEAILAFSQEHRQTFIIATHDESIAERAKRVLELSDGSVTEINN